MTRPLQITYAEQYVSMGEIANNKELKELIGFDPTSMAWCAAFVNAIEKKCGRDGTRSLAARSFLKYGKATDKPELGDIVVFKRGSSSWQGHVAYYLCEDKNGICVLGGNQDNMVSKKYYDKDRLLGFRKPT